MNRNDMVFFKRWFAEYCASFHEMEEDDRKNVILKENHTANVCDNILIIARDESLDECGVMIAEAIALFHDVGRFPQYAGYRTFRDSVSVNHGELGAKVLAGSGILDRLPLREREMITTAVRYHNAFKMPGIADPEAVTFLKLIRDADKLDIWRIFFEYFNDDSEKRPSAVKLSFPDMPEYSKEVLDCIFNRQLIALAMLKTLNDFKLTIMSWVYDLNFKISLRRAVDDNYIDRVAATLPQTDEIRKAVSFVHEYVRFRVEDSHGA